MITLLTLTLCLSQPKLPVPELYAMRPSALEEATALYKSGQFTAAEKVCAAGLQSEPENPDLLTLQGRVYVLENRLTDAAKNFIKVLRVKPDDKPTYLRLATVAYRQNSFGAAATLYEKAGDVSKAAQLKVFGMQEGNRAPVIREPIKIKMIQVDPLPMVSVSINGGAAANFLIDTGCGETILDPEFAKKVHVKVESSMTGTYAGDQKAQTGLGRADTVGLGILVVQNVPVSILSTKSFEVASKGKKVSGVLGTCFLKNFRATLDYPHGQLVIADKRGAPKLAPGAVSVPFWLYGDHYMVAEGTVGKSHEALFLVDTGLAGAAFTAPKSVLDEAGISVNMNLTVVGQGGGGAVPATPFSVPTLTLGQAKATNLIGIFGPFPPSLEEAFGFHVGGLISHEFFRPYALTFDFMAMRIYLEPVPRAKAKTLSKTKKAGHG